MLSILNSPHFLYRVNPFPNNKITTLPNLLREFADDNFKSLENGRKFSKQVDNKMGKGEIACYKQYLLFP